MKPIITICAVLTFLAAPFSAIALDDPDLFNLTALKGWQVYSEPNIPSSPDPMKPDTHVILIARSPNGSRVSITLAEPSQNAPLPTAETLYAECREEAFAAYHPIKFDKYIVPLPLDGNNDKPPVDAFVRSIYTMGAGGERNTRKDIPTISKSVYIPVVLKNGDRARAMLITADFQGDFNVVTDMRDFNDLWYSFGAVDTSYHVLSADAFKEERPTARPTEREVPEQPVLSPTAAYHAATSPQCRMPKLPIEGLPAPVIDIYD